MSLPIFADSSDGHRTIEHSLQAAQNAITSQSYFMLDGQILRNVFQSSSGCSTVRLNDFCDSWNDMPVDTYMGDRGVYRRRRHAAYHVSNDHRIKRLPHRPHYQTVNYNHLNGGVERHFEPIPHTIADGVVLNTLLQFASAVFSGVDPVASWFVEVHQFRIEAIEHGGKPTPEGAHRDGVSYVLMVLIDRQNVTGGETTIYSLAGVPRRISRSRNVSISPSSMTKRSSMASVRCFRKTETIWHIATCSSSRSGRNETLS